MANYDDRDRAYQNTTNRGWRGDAGYGQSERGSAQEAEQGYRFQELQRGEGSTGVRGAYGNAPGFTGSQGYYSGGDFGNQPESSRQQDYGQEQEYGRSQEFGSGQGLGNQQSFGAGQGYGGGQGQGYGMGGSQLGPGHGSSSGYGGQGQGSGQETQRGGEARRGQHAGRGPRGYRRSDERIGEDINDRLTEHSEIDAEDIEVQVSDGEVTLTGTVDNRWTKRMAEDVAYDVSGVTEVTNNLRTNRQGQGRQAQRDEDGSELSGRPVAGDEAARGRAAPK
jgi:BON domain